MESVTVTTDVGMTIMLSADGQGSGTASAAIVVPMEIIDGAEATTGAMHDTGGDGQGAGGMRPPIKGMAGITTADDPAAHRTGPTRRDVLSDYGYPG